MRGASAPSSPRFAAPISPDLPAPSPRPQARPGSTSNRASWLAARAPSMPSRRSLVVTPPLAGKPPRREHAVARHHDGERVPPEGLSDVAGQPRVAEARRNLAVGERAPRGDGACDLVDAPVELGDTVQLERDAIELAAAVDEQP